MIRAVMGVENAIATSVDNQNSFDHIKVYPNPSTGNFTIDLSLEAQNLIQSVDVLDLSGRMVHTQAWASNQINLDKLSPGIYFLNLIGKEGNFVFREKLIIQ